MAKWYKFILIFWSFGNFFLYLSAGVILPREYSQVQSYDKYYESIKATAQIDLECHQICGWAQPRQNNKCYSWQYSRLMSKNQCKAIYLQNQLKNKAEHFANFNLILAGAILNLILYVAFVVKFIHKRRRENQQAQRRREIAIQRFANLIDIGIRRNRRMQEVDVQAAMRDRSLLTESFLAEDREGRCVICYENFEDNKVVKLTCGHTFHRECIVQWLQRSMTCPYCRTNL